MKSGYSIMSKRDICSYCVDYRQYKNCCNCENYSEFYGIKHFCIEPIDFVFKLGELLLNEQFGYCYTCDNHMKNITIDGVNNGCDGNCSHTKEWTTQEFVIALYDEYMRNEIKNAKNLQII